MSKSTQQCLAPLVSRWAAPHTPDISGKIQYRLTAPLLSDGVDCVKVTFDGAGPAAEIGEHESPDITFTLSGELFEKLADDELAPGVANARGLLQCTLHSNRATLIARRLIVSYAKR
jgi:hypothetical protein